MFTRHFPHWPPGQPKTLEVPRDDRLRQPRGERAARHPRARRRSTTTARRITYARAEARGRRARRLPAAALRRGARRPGAALPAEQPAVRHRLLRHPARRRGGGAGQPDEPHRGAAPLRRGLRTPRWRSSARTCSSEHRAAAALEARAARRLFRLPRRGRPTCRCRTSCARRARLARHWKEALAAGLAPGPHHAQARGPRGACPTPRAPPASRRAACTRTPACRRPTVAYLYWRGAQDGSVVLSRAADVPRHRHAGRHERAAPHRARRWWCCRAGTATARRCRSSARG